jgi:hypothetical protein
MARTFGTLDLRRSISQRPGRRVCSEHGVFFLLFLIGATLQVLRLRASPAIAGSQTRAA